MHKKLPHIDAKDHYQFVTFRTNDSLDSYINKLIKDETLKQNIKQYKIDEILEYPNQAVIRLFYKNRKEVLIPVNDNTINAVDREKRIMHVNLPEGLLSVYI